MAEKMKIGIIGLGAIGTVHSNAYVDSGDAQIVALCDIDSKKLAAAGDRLNVAGRFTDYHKLLAMEDVQAVSDMVTSVRALSAVDFMSDTFRSVNVLARLSMHARARSTEVLICSLAENVRNIMPALSSLSPTKTT